MHPAVSKQLRTGRRFAIFMMLVTAVYVVGTLAEYLGGWAVQLNARAITGGGAFFLIAGVLYLGLTAVLRRSENPS